MKYCIAITLIFAVTLCAAAPPSKYTTKYDGVDLEEVLTSDRLFNSYYKCLLETGNCSPDGRELRRILPEALQTNCAKCSDNQKAGTERVIRYLAANRKEQWKKLQEKYDPNNIYATQYSDQAKSLGITV